MLRARPPVAVLANVGGSLARAGRHCAAARRWSSAAATVAEPADFVVIGAGPVGASTAWYLGEDEANEDKRIVLVHDPADRGAHEDWSRLARLSFDGPQDEFDLSKHAISLLDLVDEVRSYQSGAPVVPMRPGMLFLASPGTPMARTCAHGEAEYGDPEFVRRSVDELPDLYPGNSFDLPQETLCWTHPTGLCVSPIELADCARNTAAAYGAEVVEGRAGVGLSPDDSGLIRVTLGCGRTFDTPRAFLMAGAQSKQICAQSLAADPVLNADFAIPEFDETYITAISTVRYSHINHPSSPAAGSGHVAQPITLGQLEIPGLISFQANFSVVAEEMGDVYKTRLSGDIGTEVIETTAGLHDPALTASDAAMAVQYADFFGALFPHLETEKALDFNRCVTYRNHNPAFSGTSLLEKPVGEGATLLTTPGCFGVGVKFGPALGQAAAAHTAGTELELGMNVFKSGEIPIEEEGAERVERAW